MYSPRIVKSKRAWQHGWKASLEENQHRKMKQHRKVSSGGDKQAWQRIGIWRKGAAASKQQQHQRQRNAAWQSQQQQRMAAAWRRSEIVAISSIIETGGSGNIK